MKRRAFTLIELLVTSALFVVVSSLSIAIFTTTVRVQRQASSGQGIREQGEAVSAWLRRTVPLAATAEVSADGSSVSLNDVLSVDASGVPLPRSSYYLLCIGADAAGRDRLVAYASSGPFAPGTACSTVSTSSDPLYLSDPSVAPSRFKASTYALGTSGAIAVDLRFALSSSQSTLRSSDRGGAGALPRFFAAFAPVASVPRP